MHAVIGVDVGNFDTKTQHTTTPSGYSVYRSAPRLEKEYLSWDGQYYLSSDTRLEYVKDKTENDQCLILTLIGIAKELIWEANHALSEGGQVPTQEDVQNYLNEITTISLGAGLPVGDFNALEQKTKEYYISKLSAEVSFEYSEYSFRFSMSECAVYPQDVLPVCANPECGIASDYTKYVIIGIGGQTVDIVPIKGGRPMVEGCISDRRGVRNMFSEIIGAIDNNFGHTISEDTINEVLLGNRTPLPEEIIDLIHQHAASRASALLGLCATKNINFIEYPVVFFGGGALLLRPYLEQNDQLVIYDFITNVNGNAKYYAQFMGQGDAR